MCCSVTAFGSFSPGDMSSRHFKPEIRVTSLRFSPTGEHRAMGCGCQWALGHLCRGEAGHHGAACRLWSMSYTPG